jgi:hypothetical protein
MYKRLHTWVSFGKLPLQWAEVKRTPYPFVWVSERVDPTLVVSGHAFCSLSKEFLSVNSVLTSVGYVTMRIGYTPTRLIQLNQCCVTYVLTPKYVPSQHFLSWQLSVRWGSHAGAVSRPTTDHRIIRSWHGPWVRPVTIPCLSKLKNTEDGYICTKILKLTWEQYTVKPLSLFSEGSKGKQWNIQENDSCRKAWNVSET